MESTARLQPEPAADWLKQDRRVVDGFPQPLSSVTVTLHLKTDHKIPNSGVCAPFFFVNDIAAVVIPFGCAKKNMYTPSSDTRDVLPQIE